MLGRGMRRSMGRAPCPGKAAGMPRRPRAAVAGTERAPLAWRGAIPGPGLSFLSW